MRVPGVLNWQGREMGAGRHCATALVAIGILAMSPALFAAQAKTPTVEPLISVAQADAQKTSKAYNIAAGPLAAALNRFADESGLQLVYGAEISSGAETHGVSGTHTAESALRLLLVGTGISYRFTGPNAVTLERIAGAEKSGILLDPITVETDKETALTPVEGFVANRSTAGSKTDTPIHEVPQSVSVVTRDQIDVRGSRSVGDALAYSAGVSTGTRGDSSGLGGDNIAIRGFGGDGTAGGSGNEYWDGLKMQGTNYATGNIDPYLFDRLEVLRGPASVLYGQIQPGGIVNRVSKRPPEKFQGEVQLRGGTFDTVELDFDVGGPMTESGEFLYRVVGVVSDQDAQTEFTGRRRGAIAPSFTWKPTKDTSLTVLAAYQHDDIDGGFVKYLPALGTLYESPYGKIPRDRFTGDPNYDGWTRDVYSIGYAVEHTFNEMWTVRQNVRYLRNELDFDSVYISSLQSDDRTANRSAFGAVENSNALAVDNQVEARFETWKVSHVLLSGVDYQRNDSDTKRRFAVAPTLDLYNPVYYQDIPEPPVYQSTDYLDQQFGLYAQDQVKFENWILTFGGRQDWAKSDTTNNLTDVETKSDSNAFTGRVGLGYAFSVGVTPYVGFSQSFEPQGGTDFNGNTFDPTEGEQYEVGIKYAPVGQNAFVTLSAFHLKQKNVLTTDPVNPGYEIQTGEVRSRGIEVEGVATLDSGWNFVASYSFLDQTVTKSNDSNQGKRLTGIPRNKAALWAGYSFKHGPLKGLDLGGGVRYFGSTVGDTDNTFKVPDYTLFDAAVRYDLGEVYQPLDGAEFSVNANNLADKTYVASCISSSRCYYGIGRTVIAGLKYKW